MSEYGKLLSQLDDTISTEEDLPGTSVSFSLGDDSIRIKQKPKKSDLSKEPNPPLVVSKKEQWWLKKPAVSINKEEEKIKKDKSPALSSATSSMKDFLDKERMCKLLASSEDQQIEMMQNATDEEIGSILEEMSKIAGAMSPISESIKSKSISEILSEEEQSVEELIQEAEKLVQKNNDDIIKQILQADANLSVFNGEVDRLEASVIEMIDKQVIEKTQKKPDHQPIDICNSNLIIDQVEINSDLEERKKVRDKKESLQKEITDVDKDFFDDLVQQTKENVQQLTSRSCSAADQVDFTNFLKLLQDQSDKDTKCEMKKTTSLNLIVDLFDPLKEKNMEQNEQKEKKGNRDLMLDLLGDNNNMIRSSSRNSCKESSTKRSRSSSSCSKKSFIDNDKNELYTVGLTPRLELFADAIPKMMAEKSNEERKEMERSKSENETSPKMTTSDVDNQKDFSFKNYKSLKKSIERNDRDSSSNEPKIVIPVRDYQDFNNPDNDASDVNNFPHRLDITYTEITRKQERVPSAPENRYTRGTATIGKSKSYDQLSKNLSKSASEPRKPLVKIQSKNVPKSIPKIKSFTSKIKKLPAGNNTKAHNQSEISLDVRGNQVTCLTGGGGDWRIDQTTTSGLETLEMLYQEERQRFVRIKMDLEAEIETYKFKLKDTQMLQEQEMFSLKKQNILLKAKVDELMMQNKKTSEAKTKFDPKLMAMQKELEKQENLLIAYGTENKKLIQETKRLQGELKAKEKHQLKPKIIVADDQLASEKLKDLQEENVKLNYENTELRQKNSEFSLKCEDMTQQNLLLQDELEMIKDQLRAKNDFITDRLQIMTTNELELRKHVEDLRVELRSKTEKLKLIKQDYDNFQSSVEPLEKEIMDLRTKCTQFQEKLQTAKNNCEREKQLTQKLKDQVILDNKNIMDLNRQVREMERILKRKNPDSVSALILTANSENEKLNSEKVKLLEDRIIFLESEIQNKEVVAQTKLTDIQRKFTEMKEKYSTQVTELEQKLTRVDPREKKICLTNDTGTQTTAIAQRNLESRNSEPNIVEKLNICNGNNNNNNNNNNKAGPKSHNLKEDIHLIATIRGLKLELANKDKLLAKANKDFQDLQKTNRKLQKEREKLLNERKNLEKINKMMTGSDSKLTSLKMISSEGDSNSNFYQNGNVGCNALANGKKSSSMQKLYNQTNVAENSDNFNSNKVQKLTTENDVLKEELGRLNKDFIALKNKRLQDLNLLQEEHEKEIELIVKEYNVKVGDTKELKLQGQMNSQLAMISHLKQQMEKLKDDYREQVVILKAERDHLESKNRILNDKVKYFSTPSSQQLQVLQEKIAILQQRHETRELSLQKLVRDLLRSRGQSCRDCKDSTDKGTQQLCYYRQELDTVLDKIQDLTTP